MDNTGHFSTKTPVQISTVINSQRPHQIGPENLKLNRSAKGLKLIAEVAQTLQPFVDIKKPGWPRIIPLPERGH